MKSRSRRAVVAVSATAGVVLAAGVGLAAVDTPWSQPDSNAALSRFNATETALTTGNVGSVAYLRSITSPPLPPSDADIGCGAGVASTTAIAGGVVYSVLENHLVATTAKTGARLWSKALDTSGISSYTGPSVVGGRVLLADEDGCVTEDPAGSVTSYNASTGALQWTHGTSSPIDQMLVSGQFVVTGGKSGEGDDFVTVINLATGTQAWQKVSSCGDLTVAVVDGVLAYTVCDDNGHTTLVGATLATGATRWSRTGDWQVQRGDTDATSGHHLYVLSNGKVLDLNPSTGTTRFTLTGATQTLAVDNDRTYATCAAGLCAYVRATGALSWSKPAAGFVAVANGLIFTASGAVLRASNGTPLTTLWVDGAKHVSVGDGYVAADTDPRIIDLYGLAGS